MLFYKTVFQELQQRIKMINEQVQQMNEDIYGNEVKRRRTSDNGEHLKVWRAFEISYVHAGDEVEVEEEKVVLVVQQEEEEEAQVQEEPVAVAQPQEEPQQLLHLIGRTIIVKTSDQMCRGTLEELFVLNGERAIHVLTSDGAHHIFTSSQILDLRMLHNPATEEMLSPIAPVAAPVAWWEVPPMEPIVQIDDDNSDVEEIIRRIEAVQIESDDDDDANTVEHGRDQEDDFPEIEFQPARRDQRQEQEEDEEEDAATCCAICLDITDAARNFVSLDCGHQFHFACMMHNMAAGGPNRNSCPMCRGAVNQHYEVHSLGEHNLGEYDAGQQMDMEEMFRIAARSNQRLHDELERTRQQREELTAEYVRVMSMNMQIGMRHNEERAAMGALERRAQLFYLNERIVSVVENAANNDIRRQPGAVPHVERMIRELCMNFAITAYDAQYDDAQYDDPEQHDAQHDPEQHDAQHDAQHDPEQHDAQHDEYAPYY